MQAFYINVPRNSKVHAGYIVDNHHNYLWWGGGVEMVKQRCDTQANHLFLQTQHDHEQQWTFC